MNFFLLARQCDIHVEGEMYNPTSLHYTHWTRIHYSRTVCTQLVHRLLSRGKLVVVVHSHTISSSAAAADSQATRTCLGFRRIRTCIQYCGFASLSVYTQALSVGSYFCCCLWACSSKQVAVGSKTAIEPHCHLMPVRTIAFGCGQRSLLVAIRISVRATE